ncbi:MAG: hypothetical protein ACI92O_003246 [Colwellia sp.]|jgi:hypothetical protein
MKQEKNYRQVPVGSSNMKIYLITLIILINASFDVTAANITGKNYSVDAKCYVELEDGEKLIYLATVKEHQINTLVDTIAGKEVPTPYTAKKQLVQKAFECVLLESKFNSRKANELFEKQPR